MKEVPITARRIAATNAGWTDRVEKAIEEYTKEMDNRVFEYKKRKMWTYNVGVPEALKDMDLADYWLAGQVTHRRIFILLYFFLMCLLPRKK